MSTELLRDHTGSLNLYSDGRPVDGVSFSSIVTNNQGEQVAVLQLPLTRTTFGEVRNVVPFVRPPQSAQ
ncbi:hypothetical protein SAMN06295905_1351 [Devosia lucknowensis]|uniref:Uncharacterized protein n=1 Tax=Devosia lucknowensis TaxID=1096929 RepID=A0A1Y6EUE9_9HYPH|nr:hypothetical protein [Devosia lucknowensis]SMQ65926.1 hypothetical protein SAMN06295905_1351 [Devosia lucknowensis]